MDVKVIVVTNKKDKFAGYSVTRVDDSKIENYVPVLEMLSFALILHLEEADERRDARLKELYRIITQNDLSDSDIGQIASGSLALVLPPVERISIEVYNPAIEVLRAA